MEGDAFIFSFYVYKSFHRDRWSHTHHSYSNHFSTIFNIFKMTRVWRGTNNNTLSSISTFFSAFSKYFLRDIHSTCIRYSFLQHRKFTTYIYMLVYGWVQNLKSRNRYTIFCNGVAWDIVFDETMWRGMPIYMKVHE